MIMTLDDLEAQKQVKRIVQYLENRMEKLQDYLSERDRRLNLNVQYEDLQKEIRSVSKQHYT